MHRIDTAFVVSDLFGPGKSGFTDGDPQAGSPSTFLNAAWFNAIQEEIAQAAERSGIVLDMAKRHQLFEAMRKQAGNFRVSAGTADALTIALDPAPASYLELVGVPLRLRMAASNTAAATLDINGLGAKEIVRQDGKPIVRNDLLAGDIKTIVYDGTRFRVFTVISSIERTLTLSAVSNQYMTDGVETFVSWVPPQSGFDPLGFFNPAQPTRVTIPAGISIVRLGFAVGLEPSTFGYRSARVLQNGAIEGGGRPLDVVETPLAGQIAIPNAVGAPIAVAPSDYFQLAVFTNPGGPHLLRQGNTNMTIEY